MNEMMNNEMDLNELEQVAGGRCSKCNTAQTLLTGILCGIGGGLMAGPGGALLGFGYGMAVGGGDAITSKCKH